MNWNIRIKIAVLDLGVQKEFHNQLINSIAKYSLLIYLIHANYFWLTYGKYWLLGNMMDYGIEKAGAVVLLITIYSVVTVILSAAYEISIGKLTAKISGKFADKFKPKLYIVKSDIVNKKPALEIIGCWFFVRTIL